MVRLEIEIFDEIVEWMKDLKKPLKSIINEVAKKLDELDPEDNYDEEWLNNLKIESRHQRNK